MVKIISLSDKYIKVSKYPRLTGLGLMIYGSWLPRHREINIKIWNWLMIKLGKKVQNKVEETKPGAFFVAGGC